MKIKINKDNLIKILISLDIIVIVVILELMFLEKIPEQEENKVKVAIQSTNEKENNILDNQIDNNLIENIVLENTNVEDSNTTNKIEKLENTDEKSEENSTAKKTNNNTKSTNSNTIKKDNESNKTSNNNKNNSTSTSKPSNDKEESKEEEEETKPSDDDKNEDNGTFYQSECKTMFNELNKFRKENGKKVLSYSNSLESYAKIRAKEIAKSFSHTRPGGGTILDVSSIYGENIGLASLKNSNLMLDKFINSTEHRKNLLNENFKTVGIACYYSKEKNQFYWVQLFGI